MITAIIIMSVMLCIYYALFLMSIYRGLLKLQCDNTDEKNYLPITVIIPFRNEEKTIRENIKSIHNLEYPAELLEVIYVDDGSTDAGNKILNKLISSPNVRVLSMPNTNKGSKKKAVEFGIEHSKAEIIVATDADCTYNPKWLKTISSKFDAQTGFVAGPADIISATNLFKKFQKIEFIGLILSGAGLIGIEKPVIASAANIAYRKSLFQKLGGYGDLHNFSSGDDELLMQKIKNETKYKIKFNFCRDAVVATKASPNLKEFFDQRKRWASKGLFYNSKLLVVSLILIYLFYLFIPFNFVLAILVSTKFLFIGAFLLLVKFSLEFLIMEYGCRKLFEKGILKYFLPAQFIQIPYILISAFTGLFGNIKWKGRSRAR